MTEKSNVHRLSNNYKYETDSKCIMIKLTPRSKEIHHQDLFTCKTFLLLYSHARDQNWLLSPVAPKKRDANSS